MLISCLVSERYGLSPKNKSCSQGHRIGGEMGSSSALSTGPGPVEPVGMVPPLMTGNQSL